MPRRDLRAGDYVSDRYRIVGEPLHGGMGVVFIVQDLESDSGDFPQQTRYALKSLRFDDWNSPDAETFKREIAAWLSLADHPHVIGAHDLVTFRKQPYLVLEYAAGGNLAQRLRRGLPDGAAILRIAAQICRGMIHLHERGLIHRDLKPSNVLFDAADLAHVTDLGLSGQARGTTMDGSLPASFAGTLQYASPEHFVALAACEARSDIYSFGALLYELVCGRPVFAAKSFQEYRRLHCEQAPVPPAMRNGLTDHEWQTLTTVIDRCLVKRPDDRYGTFSDVLDALQPRTHNVPTGSAPVPIDRARAPSHDGPDEMTKAEGLSTVGLFAEALEVLERPVTTGLRYWRLKGQCHLALGAVPEAVAALSRAAFVDPSDALTRHALARCLPAASDPTTVTLALELHASPHFPELAVSHGFAYVLCFDDFDRAVFAYLEVVRRLETKRAWDYGVVVFAWDPPRFFPFAVLVGAPYKQSDALGTLLTPVRADDLESLQRPPERVGEHPSLGAFADVIRHSRSFAWTSHVSRPKVKFSAADIETDVRFRDRRIPLALVRLGVAKLDPALLDDVVALVYSINNIERRRLVAKDDAPPGFVGGGSIHMAGRTYSDRNMWETERRSRRLFLHSLRDHLSNIDRARSAAVPDGIREHVLEYARRLVAFYATSPKPR